MKLSEVRCGLSGKPKEANTKLTNVKRALCFVFPYRTSIIFIFALTLGTAAFEAAEPLILKYLFDGMGKGILRVLSIGVTGLLILGVLREIFCGISNWMAWKVKLGISYELLEATVGRLHTLPISYHQRESVGSIMTKMDKGINGLVGALSDMAFVLLPGVVYLAVSLAVMIRLDWRLSLLMLFFAPLPAFIGMWAAQEQTQRERNLMNRWSKIFARLYEVLSGIVTVKSFAMEEEEKKRFLNEVHEANGLVLNGVGMDTRVGAAKSMTSTLARIGAIAMGGYFVSTHQITVGTLIAFLGYISGLFGPVQGLTGVYQTVRKATVSLDVIFSILDADDHLKDSQDAGLIKVSRGEVLFKDVCFHYQPGTPVLTDINLEVKSGEVTALVGPSGAGKSTAMQLLQRLHEPVSGSILIDGTDLRGIKQRCLRQQISIVLQDGVLFNDTVRNNIAYGKPGASQKEIEEAAKWANAHNFITGLANGYSTLVGERGGRLSAGERQRINMARAFLKNAPILIMDEATSALDAETEALIQEALYRLTRSRTTFIIAHRLSTVIGADRILVLKSGKIIESGRHEDLMEMGGYYATLVRCQTRGFLRSEAA